MPDNNLDAVLAEGRALLAAAAEGPWQADGSEIYRADAYEDGTGRRAWVGETCDVNIDSLGDENAALIVWMRNNLADLFDHIETLQRGGELLAHALKTYNQIALDVTGLHDVINENGDGDWQVVWENVADLGDQLARLRADRERELVAIAAKQQRDAKRIAELEAQVQR
ncbi:hypothetical protein [Nocardia asiatica]|uniref:hypothetical protein n=1 Tax=Nocardia asiatica TaxID=209252 RepID=UPI00245865BA|nr:hypothetical protein [Nocardia asiatica]